MDGALAVAFLNADEAEQTMGMGGVGVDLESLVGAVARLREVVGVGGDSGVDVLPVDLPFGGEQKGVLADDALAGVEIFERTGEGVLGVVQDLVLRHQVIAICLDVRKGALMHMLILGRCELDLKGRDDLARDVFLNGEDVIKGAVVLVGPEQGLALGIDKLGGDPDVRFAVARGIVQPDRSFKDIADIEVGGDFARESPGYP